VVVENFKNEVYYSIAVARYTTHTYIYIYEYWSGSWIGADYNFL